jgi:hypothetical protein
LGDGKVEGSREREGGRGEETRGNKVPGRVEEDCGDGDGSARARESPYLGLGKGRAPKSQTRSLPRFLLGLVEIEMR